MIRIAYMPETTIDINSDGQIEIIQKNEQIDDSIIQFPVELAEKIANEILRLAGVARESSNTPPFPRPRPLPEG